MPLLESVSVIYHQVPGISPGSLVEGGMMVGIPEWASGSCEIVFYVFSKFSP